MLYGQCGFLDNSKYLTCLTQLGDLLIRLNEVIDGEMFHPMLGFIIRSSKSNKGVRPPFDEVLIFKIQRLNILSDDHMEFPTTDCFSYRRFLNLQLRDKISDTKTIGNSVTTFLIRK